MPFAETSVHLKMIILSEVSQKEKDKYHKIYQLYEESKIWHNEPIYKAETDSQA